MQIKYALIELCPDYIDAYINLSYRYILSKDYDKAAKISKAGLENDPFDPTLHLNLGASYNLQGKFKKAKKELEKATELDPELEPAWDQLGRLCLFQLKDYYAATQAFEKAYSIKPKALTLYKWSISLANFDDYSSAIKRAQLCNNNYSNNSFCYGALSLIYSRSKDKKYLNGEKAVEYANRVLQLEGEKSWVLGILSSAQARFGDFDSAVENCSKSIEITKKDQSISPSHKKLYIREKLVQLKNYRQRLPYTDGDSQ